MKKTKYEQILEKYMLKFYKKMLEEVIQNEVIKYRIEREKLIKELRKLIPKIDIRIGRK
mgnify:CR=1 FL=1